MSLNKPTEQLISVTVAGITLPKLSIDRKLEPFYRRAAGLAMTGEGGTIDNYYKAFKEVNRNEDDDFTLRKTLLEIAYRSEFMKEELKQVYDDMQQLDQELMLCLETCSL